MKTVYTATVMASGGREGHIRSSDGNLDVDLQTFEKRKEGVKGTDPEQLFAGAYAACFESALRHVARIRKINIEESSITARVSLNQNDQQKYYLSVELRGRVRGLSPAEALELMQGAHSVCPYSKAIKGNVEVKLAAE